MNYEEKYKEALRKADAIRKGECEQTFVYNKKLFEYIFPELSMSEDERIRKWITDDIRYSINNEPLNNSEYKKNAEKAIVCLEKQGEPQGKTALEASKEEKVDNQNCVMPADKVEPKFKKGDRIHFKTEPKDKVYTVDHVLDNRYVLDVKHECISVLFINQDLWELVEQKPADEPKFKVGNWVVYKENIYQIHNISLKKYYECLRTDGTVYVFDFENINSKSHLWTIQDAKDGDVLNSKRVHATIIFKGFADDGKHILAYCALQKGIFIKQEMLWDRDFEPASEYWKNALYDAMVKAGYEWDADRLKLTKCEQRPAEWSEEDEKMLKSVIWHLRNSVNNGGVGQSADELEEWLKSLKERIK